MKTPIALILLATLPAWAQNDKPAPALEPLIDQLANVAQGGFGYSAGFSGTQFLPVADSGEWRMGLLGSAPPQPSEAMLLLVKGGAESIPLLVKHLDDKRPTKIKPMSGMMWMGWNDEYDYNRRTKHEAPKGVNRDTFGEENHPDQHQITVGDLCFVALGQIVNRQFSAVRYQPTGGLVINSPSYSKALLAAARGDYEGMDAAKHRQQLIDDFTKPDSEDCRNGAAMRLAYYYPETLDDLVLQQLKTPTFDVFKVNDFVRDVLYPKKDAAQRRKLMEAFVAKHGAAARDGVLMELFEDLDQQIADEEGRLSPPLKGRYDARNVLMQLYDYPKDVAEKDKPYIDTWEEMQRARFIESLRTTTSDRLLKEVKRMFDEAGKANDDDLALACIKVLRGRGADAEFIAYCKRRIGKDEHTTFELKEMLQALGASNAETKNGKTKVQKKAGN